MNGYAYDPDLGLRYYGVPARDMTKDEYEALTPSEQRVVRESPAYEETHIDDPLGELTNAEFDKLTPSEKGVRTRESNKRAEAAAEATEEEERRVAEAAAAQEAAQELTTETKGGAE